MKLISIVVRYNYVSFLIIITVLLHCVVVKETRNWHIMPLNYATLLFLNAMITRCTRGVRVVFSVTRMRSSNSARMNKSDFTNEKIV